MPVNHGDYISDGGVIWRAEDTRLYGYVADIPNFYERENLFTIQNKTEIVTPSRLLVNIGGQGYIAEASSTININSAASWCNDSKTAPSYASPANRAGKDVYIYAVKNPNSEAPGFLLSKNSTVPGGYTAATSRKIGGFHCLCVDVGTPVVANPPPAYPTANPLSGYVAGNILPNSVWDLQHRPSCSPEGMIWVEGINKWVDIYPNSWDGYKLISKYNSALCTGALVNSARWNGDKFAECLGLIGKTLPSRDEFIAFSKGSNEGTNISGGSILPAGGHRDTANRRMISNYGIEDCCGLIWQWTRDYFEDYPGSARTNDTSNYSLSGYTFLDVSTYNTADSTDSGRYGYTSGLLRRAAVGGGFNNGANCGTRSTICYLYTSASFNVNGTTKVYNIGARGVADMIKR